MAEADEYFQMAVANCKKAEAYLEDAEHSLHALLESLNTCLNLVGDIRLADSRWPEQRPVTFVGNRRAVGISRASLLSS